MTKLTGVVRPLFLPPSSVNVCLDHVWMYRDKLSNLLSDEASLGNFLSSSWSVVSVLSFPKKRFKGTTVFRGEGKKAGLVTNVVARFVLTVVVVGTKAASTQWIPAIAADAIIKQLVVVLEKVMVFENVYCVLSNTD
jgi:hypothetical protein